MTLRVIVSGTDTGVGKTVFCAALADALGASYWKPVQAGLEDETDSEIVQRLGRLPPERVLPERWRLQTPASPHRAAEVDNVAIAPDALEPPALDGSMVIEGAGGLLVPLTREMLLADVFSRWRLPLILCARTSLGTINHTLLSIEAVRRRAIPLLGVAFIGDENTDTEGTITDFGRVRKLGRLPRLHPLTADSLRSAFASAFNLAEFHGAAS